MPRLAPKLPGLARWLPWHRRSGGGENGHGPQEDPLLEAGRRLRQEREQRGLSLRQLALETRISTPVLEALERGWRDRLPEAAYLRTMLPLIEQRLDLPGGSLIGKIDATNIQSADERVVRRSGKVDTRHPVAAGGEGRRDNRAQ